MMVIVFFVDGICDTCEEGVVVNNDTDGDGVCDADEVVVVQMKTLVTMIL